MTRESSLITAGKPVLVTPDERRQLEKAAASPTSAQRDAYRARIVLGLADGASGMEVAEALQTSRQAVSRWRCRWLAHGIAGLRDVPGRGRKRHLNEERCRQALAVERMANPEGGQWSTRAMARLTGLSHMSVSRLWRSHNLKPHAARNESGGNGGAGVISRHANSVTPSLVVVHVACSQSNGGRKQANAIASLLQVRHCRSHIAASAPNAPQGNKQHGVEWPGDAETAIRTTLMGNLKNSKDAKGKKGPVQGGDGPVVVVLEESVAKDLFLALAQALGAPIDKKKKKKKKKKKDGGKKAAPLK